MTRVNLLLPLFELSLTTNNSEVIQNALRAQYPGMPVHDIFWIQSDKPGHYECAVKVADMPFNFEAVAENMARVKSLESSIAKLKTDLFNFVRQYDQLLSDKAALTAKLDKLRDEPNNFSQDASVSLKIEERLRSPAAEGADRRERELLQAISELTRENLKLKDTLSYSQAHVEFLTKGAEEKVPLERQAQK